MTAAPGSVGIVQPQRASFGDPLRLSSGATLPAFELMYETYGTLAPAKDNVILVCHALSGDAHAAGWSDDPTAPVTVDGVGTLRNTVRRER